MAFGCRKRTPSPNSPTGMMPLKPFINWKAVFPLDRTLNLVMFAAACRIIHGTIGWSSFTFAFNRLSRLDLNVLVMFSTSWTDTSIVALLLESPTLDSSDAVADPRCLANSAFKSLIAGSWSFFTMILSSLSPIVSRSYKICLTTHGSLEAPLCITG